MSRGTVIIPVFNQAALTAQCLRTVLELDSCDVVVVDDASTDSTREVLAGFGNKIRVVTHEQNLGFANSCNHGASEAASEFLIFLNNDTIPQSGWLEALIGYAETHQQAAVVGSKLVYPDGTIQHAGVIIGQDRFPRHIYSGFPAQHPSVNKSRRFQMVTAACVLVRTPIFRAASGFDTSFHNGFEDVDFCLRLGERGHEIHYCAQSVVQHLESVSPGRFGRDRDNVARYRERWLERVRPDDLDYYVQDGLLQLTYEGRYPIVAEFSPLLATLDGAARISRLEDTVRRQSRQLAELRRENTRLALELGTRAQISSELNYHQLRQAVRDVVRRLVPAGATVLVTSKGDGTLLEFPARRGWHFPQTERGAYAGYHPANGLEAISWLEVLRNKGAEYLLIPATSLWWLDYYTEFRRHLEANYLRLDAPEELCALYCLSQSGGAARNRGAGKQRHITAAAARPLVREYVPHNSQVSWA